MIELPAKYDQLTPKQRALVRHQYIGLQNGKCMFCNSAIIDPPPLSVTSKRINWKLFPVGFLKAPVHLQHDHKTGYTEGAVHAYCNAVMWQYHGR